MQIEIKLDERALEVLTKLAEAFKPAFITKEPEPVPPAEFPEEPKLEFCDHRAPIELPELSLEDLRESLLPIIKDHRDVVLKVLSEFKVSNIKELLPEQRPQVLEAVRRELA